MNKHRTFTRILLAFSFLTLANCGQTPTGSKDTKVEDKVQASDFGTDTTPSTNFKQGPETPAGKIGAEANTIIGMGSPATKNQFEGLSSLTETPGVAPLSMPTGFDFEKFKKLVPPESVLPSFINPTNVRFFPRPELLNIYYCSIQDLLGYEASRKAAYVEALYLDVLGRLADPAGFVAAIKELANVDDMPTREKLARRIVRSNENYERIVDGLFRTVLERLQRPNEGIYFVNRLKEGASIEQVTAEFHGSNLNYVTRLRRNNRLFIREIYRKVLSRNPNSQNPADYIQSWEITHWVNARPLNTWANRTLTALDIINSFEARIKFAQAMYLKYLGRVGEAAGVQYWTDQMMTKGQFRFDVEVKFLSSEEYFNRSALTRFLSLNSPQYCREN